MANHQNEVEGGQRYQFGKNWEAFLKVVDKGRILEAERSLCEMLGQARLNDLTFLDVGCGSGLFSLAAHRLGASVRSFDYDPVSVSTARELRNRYGTSKNEWIIESGSILDAGYLAHLGQFDVVYAWGVLHHTGNMRQAMENVIPLVTPGGTLFIALYNDQGTKSTFWRSVKKMYCSDVLGKIAVITAFFPVFAIAGLLNDISALRNPLRRYMEYRKRRGMSLAIDWMDWLGGYPYEAIKPDQVFEFYFERGFVLHKLVTRQTLGCNEFVFRRSATDL